MPDRRVWVARAALLGAFLLALATSVSATPFLVTLIALEVVRGWARADRAAPLWPALRWTLGLGLVALGSEWLVRSYYGRYSEERLGLDPRWSVDLDTEFLAQNLRRHLDNLAGLDWWPLYAVAALSPLALVVLGLSRPPRDRGAVVARVRAALADDVAVLWLGAGAIATLHLALVVAADHVRANGHDPRYLALTHQFAPFAGLMALLWLTERAAGPFSPRLRASAWIAGVLLLLLAMPERRPSTQYETVRRIAAALEQRAPGGVLIGGYWQTYVFASLQPRAPMTPVPLESSRTPWTIEAARRADQVVVEYLLSGLGPLGDPPRRITQQGLSLHLTEPRWYADGGHAFALYRRGGDRLRQDGFEGGDTCRWSRTSGGTGCP